MKKKKIASAVAYSPGDPAPMLLASGRGREADQIIAIAQEEGITIVEDAPLAALLDSANPGEYIPPWCWEAAAGVLAFVLNRWHKEK